MDYDDNQKLAPQMRYQTSLDAVPQRNENYTEPADDEVIESMTSTEASNGDSQNTEPLIDQSNGNAGGLNAMRQSLEDAIFNDYIEGLKMRDQGAVSEAQIEGIRNLIKAQSFDDLMDTVTALRQACRKNGVLMLDDQGNPMMGC